MTIDGALMWLEGTPPVRVAARIIQPLGVSDGSD